MTDEHRKAPRLRTLKGGSITFGPIAGLECIVRNLSETGAALEITGETTVPDQFSLIIKPEVVRRNCEVVWRKQKRVGVRFV